MDRIPVTVLTGFLGSGKTTLLNRILSESHGQRIAVIENEFGEIGIDQALVVNAEEEVFEMNNGCICCTVRGDLIRILGSLMKRRDKFDRILVETTGLADPGPVAQTFFVDDDMRALFALDGIVTLVDAKHVELHLDESSECLAQIAFADVLVLNKTDLVSAAELGALERRLGAINSMASVLRAEMADVPIREVLDVGGFDLERALEKQPAFLVPEYPFEWAGTFELAAGDYRIEVRPGPDPSLDVLALYLAPGELAHASSAAGRAVRVWAEPPCDTSPDAVIEVGASRRASLHVGPSGLQTYRLRVPSAGTVALYTQHLPSEFELELSREGRVPPLVCVEFAAGHSHDQSVASVGIHLEGGVDRRRLEQWIGALLREKGADIFRMKGIVNIQGADQRFVFQGVHMLFDGREDRPWGNGPRASDVVFIGRNLDRAALTAGLERCRA